MSRNPIQFLNSGDNPRLADMLGMGPMALRKLSTCRSAQEAQACFDKMKEGVPRLFKELALSMHPDRCPDDPDATKNFAALSAVKDVLLELRLQIRPRPPQPRVVIVNVSGGFGGGYSTTSATSTTTTGGGWHRY